MRCFDRIRAALEGVRSRGTFRVVHYSVQGDHVHIIVEAENRRSMSNGLRALLIRMAKQLNAEMGVRGSRFVDRRSLLLGPVVQRLERAGRFAFLETLRPAADVAAGVVGAAWRLAAGRALDLTFGARVLARGMRDLLVATVAAPKSPSSQR